MMTRTCPSRFLRSIFLFNFSNPLTGCCESWGRTRAIPWLIPRKKGRKALCFGILNNLSSKIYPITRKTYLL